MVNRGILPEDKHLLNRHWGNLWEIPVKDKKLWLIEVVAAIKFGKLSSYIETSGG